MLELVVLHFLDPPEVGDYGSQHGPLRAEDVTPPGPSVGGVTLTAHGRRRNHLPWAPVCQTGGRLRVALASYKASGGRLWVARDTATSSTASGGRLWVVSDMASGGK